MVDTLIELAGVTLVLCAFGLFIAAASWVGWPLAVLVAGLEAAGTGGALIVLASKRERRAQPERADVPA